MSNTDLKNKNVFKLGLRDGSPIGLGYFAVAFSLGIAAQRAGITPLQSMLASLLCNASAGEYAGFTLIAVSASYIEMLIVTLIANARYILMSCAISQRMSQDLPLIHRLIIGFSLTDELFGIAISRQGYINPYYSYGAFCVASPCWAIGTALGAVAGNILPHIVVSALSVALFGMFLAIIVPPARNDKIIKGVIAVCFVLGYLATVLPIISSLSDGVRTIILTVIISSAFAIIFPKEDKDET